MLRLFALLLFVADLGKSLLSSRVELLYVVDSKFLSLIWGYILTKIQGSIVRPRGPTNFGRFILYLLSLLRLNRSILIDCLGWDPIFEYEGKTYAEMEKEAKVRTEKHVVRIIFSLLFFL